MYIKRTKHYEPAITNKSSTSSLLIVYTAAKQCARFSGFMLCNVYAALHNTHTYSLTRAHSESGEAARLHTKSTKRHVPGDWSLEHVYTLTWHWHGGAPPRTRLYVDLVWRRAAWNASIGWLGMEAHRLERVYTLTVHGGAPPGTRLYVDFATYRRRASIQS